MSQKQDVSVNTIQMTLSQVLSANEAKLPVNHVIFVTEVWQTHMVKCFIISNVLFLYKLVFHAHEQISFDYK